MISFIMNVEKLESGHSEDLSGGPINFQEVSDSIEVARKLIKKFEQGN